MEHSKSSRKVTVEYTDPSGIYAIISEDLQTHFPLRNLYWNSATRPLRSIPSLHIELVQAASPPASFDPSGHNKSVALNGAAGNTDDPDTLRGSRSESGVGGKKGRRHQIPGLRQTPYLKIFFLGCSDVESYKTTYRKQIREWIKQNTPPAQNTASFSTQEFHDAFEWLIVHVVLPDDGRSISRASATGKSESRNGLAGSAAVTEKVRADFNGSSKTAVDRVALVQITRGSQTSQTQASSEGWEDFVSKTKSLILSSFDLRVTQYEEDIKEKDAQRNIPGWNFNTFFVLKEGLARGFESVGLVEDALTGYRELALGLNSIIEKKNGKEQHEEQFKDFTDDLSAILKSALQSEKPQNVRERETITANTVTPDGQAKRDLDMLGANVLDADRKPFRDLILANEISVFDFQCYLFAREATLLLRLANASDPFDGSKKASVKVASTSAPSDSQDLLLLAEVCRRSVEFFSAAGRLMRDDLRSSVHPLAKSHTTTSPTLLSIFEGPIEDMVASWTYAACQCILDATNVRSIQAQLEPLLRNLTPTEDLYDNSNTSTSLPSREELPRRTSSLPLRAQLSPRPSSPVNVPAVTSLNAARLLPPTSSQAGTQELAAQQAELVLLKRRVIASLGRRSNNARIKRIALAGPLSLTESEMEEISLDKPLPSSNRTERLQETHHGDAVNSIHGKTLSHILRSKSTYDDAYKDFTIVALALNVVGGRRRFAESLTVDLAAIRYLVHDYSIAASYFYQLAFFYHNNDWTRLELPMLDLYAKCLKHLDKRQDFCRTGLQILARSTSRQLFDTHAESNHHLSSNDIRHYLHDVISISWSLEQPLSTPLHLHFDSVYVDPYIQHFDEQDGFQLSLKLRNAMSAAIEAQEIRVKLLSINDEQPYDIWLVTKGSELLQTGISNVKLQSTVMCPAWYKLEKIEIQSANVVFTHDATVPTEDAPRGSPSISEGVLSESTPILVWPDEKALEAQLSLSKSIHLGKPRSIEISVLSGRNQISHGKVTVRACSAGLRLHTAEADLINGACQILEKSQAGSLNFSGIDSRTKTTFQMPYDIESDLSEIKIKVVITYTVEGQEYHYHYAGELPVRLPLSVNVQDSFQEQSLFSQFKIATASSIPLRISEYTMHSTSAFNVTLRALGSNPLTIFARQPLSLVAKVRHSRSTTAKARTWPSADRNLMLRIRYACLDHEVINAVEDALSKALAESEFTELSRLLVTTLSKTLRSKLTFRDYETIGLLGEFQLSSFGHHMWRSDNSSICLPQEVDSRSALELLVPFEIPEMPIVVTGRLNLLNCHGGAGEGIFAAIDQLLLAELSLSYSRYWATTTEVVPDGDLLTITYEVQASPEAWLIGGQCRGHFHAKVT
ncbi:MAG: hypothetical protein Q9213_000178 [Squamulea squamosa]